MAEGKIIGIDLDTTSSVVAVMEGNEVKVIANPKAARRSRLRENLGALDVELTPAQLAELDQLFPPPTGPRPLEVI